jgi:hypothetical protein
LQNEKLDAENQVLQLRHRLDHEHGHRLQLENEAGYSVSELKAKTQALEVTFWRHN